jgi:FHA domain-containing protein
MSIQLKLKVMEIYAQYQRLRQNGATLEDAIRDVQSDVKSLPEEDQAKLKRLVTEWEKDQTSEALPTPATPANLPRIDPLPPQRIQPIRLEPSVACPVCGRLNRKGANCCAKCGYDLSLATPFGTKRFSGDESHRGMTTNHLGEHTALLLNIRGQDTPLLIKIHRDMTIGRIAKGSSAYPDIDLSLYNAEELGVSRLHAMFKRQEDRLVIIDLNSSNKTFINGQRLFPNERRVLRDGDQVRMGDLVMQVIFKD